MLALRFVHMRYLLPLLCIVVVTGMWVINNVTGPAYEPGDIEHSQHCASNLVDRRRLLPPAAADAATSAIYAVTPTYRRVEQMAELTRLGQTMLTVANVTWMVVEDADTCSPHVTALLDRLGMPYVHMACPMPAQYRRVTYVPRGVAARRAALRWLRAAAPAPAGVLYFLDDDNAIDIRLFEQMRGTRKVSMFPVGLVGDYLVSAPIVKEGRVTGFFDSWPAGRRFAVDMAGFALNLRVVLANKGTMPYHAGYEEDKLLQNLGLSLEDIEPLANQCTEVMVWHTKTKKNSPPNLLAEAKKHKDTNVKQLLYNMEAVAMATT